MRKVLLDENLPRRLAEALPEHNVTTVSEHGWAGSSNGQLLHRASDEFEVFVTGDQGIEYQQNISAGEVGVVVVQAPSNRFEDLRPLAPNISSAIEQVGSEEIVNVPR